MQRMKALEVAPVGNDLLPDTDNDADGLIPLKITRGCRGHQLCHCLRVGLRFRCFESPASANVSGPGARGGCTTRGSKPEVNGDWEITHATHPVTEEGFSAYGGQALVVMFPEDF